jgi:predicted nucleic acid-binding protein
MKKIIISDTSCLILLDKIGELNLLNQLFKTITITAEIAEKFNKTLLHWILIENPVNKNYQKILEATLDKGEASAIALAIEHNDCLLIIDDLKGRKYAENLGLNITGTLGILIDAKLNGYLKSIKPSLKKINKTDFRISDELIAKAIEKCGE